MWATVAGLQYEISEFVCHVFICTCYESDSPTNILRLAAGNLVRAVYFFSSFNHGANEFCPDGSRLGDEQLATMYVKTDLCRCNEMIGEKISFGPHSRGLVQSGGIAFHAIRVVFVYIHRPDITSRRQLCIREFAFKSHGHEASLSYPASSSWP